MFEAKRYETECNRRRSDAALDQRLHLEEKREQEAYLSADTDRRKGRHLAELTRIRAERSVLLSLAPQRAARLARLQDAKRAKERKKIKPPPTPVKNAHVTRVGADWYYCSNPQGIGGHVPLSVLQSRQDIQEEFQKEFNISIAEVLALGQRWYPGITSETPVK